MKFNRVRLNNVLQSEKEDGSKQKGVAINLYQKKE